MSESAHNNIFTLQVWSGINQISLLIRFLFIGELSASSMSAMFMCCNNFTFIFQLCFLVYVCADFVNEYNGSGYTMKTSAIQQRQVGQIRPPPAVKVARIMRADVLLVERPGLKVDKSNFMVPSLLFPFMYWAAKALNSMISLKFPSMACILNSHVLIPRPCTSSHNSDLSSL